MDGRTELKYPVRGSEGGEGRAALTPAPVGSRPKRGCESSPRGIPDSRLRRQTGPKGIHYQKLTIQQDIKKHKSIKGKERQSPTRSVSPEDHVPVSLTRMQGPAQEPWNWTPAPFPSCPARAAGWTDLVTPPPTPWGKKLPNVACTSPPPAPMPGPRSSQNFSGPAQNLPPLPPGSPWPPVRPSSFPVLWADLRPGPQTTADLGLGGGFSPRREPPERPVLVPGSAGPGGVLRSDAGGGGRAQPCARPAGASPLLPRSPLAFAARVPAPRPPDPAAPADTRGHQAAALRPPQGWGCESRGGGRRGCFHATTALREKRAKGARSA